MDIFFFVTFVVFSRIISVVFKTITFCNEQGRLKQYLSMKEEHKNTRFQMHTRIYYIIMKYNIMNTFSKETKQYVMNTKHKIYHIWRNVMLMYINNGKQKSLWWLFSPVKQQEYRFTRHVPQTIDEIVKLFELFSIHHNIYDV